MQSRSEPFSPNFNFGTVNLMVQQDYEQGGTFPPVAGNFKLLDGTDIKLLDGTNLLLL